MNSLTLHEEHARQNLNDRAVWLGLVDHHEELLGVSHRVALRAVAAMRRQQRRSADLEQAVNIMTVDLWQASDIRSAILAWVGMEWAVNTSLHVVEGRSLPKAKTDASSPVPIRACLSVEVGALWVLKLADLRRRCREIPYALRADVLGALVCIE